MSRLTLPNLTQKDGHSCGLVALNVVLAFYRRKQLPQVAAGVPSELDGTDPRTLEAVLRGQGLKVQAGEMDLEDVDYHVRRGRPVVALVQLGTVGHYVVVSGVRRDRYDGWVSFQCPVTGPAAERSSLFRARWHDRDRLGSRYDGWGMVVGA